MHSEDHPNVLPVHSKRSSFDDTNAKMSRSTTAPDQGGHRTSSLPRGAKIASSKGSTSAEGNAGGSSLVDASTTRTDVVSKLNEKKEVTENKVDETGEFVAVEMHNAQRGLFKCFLNFIIRCMARFHTWEGGGEEIGIFPSPKQTKIPPQILII